MHPVAFSEVLLSWLCRLLLRRVSTHSGARLLRGSSPPGGPLRLLRGSVSRWSPSPTQRHVSSRGSLPAKRMGLASVARPSYFRKPLYGNLRPTRRSCRELFSPREIPISPDVGAMRREALSPLNSSIHLGLRLKIPIKGSLEAYLQDPLITIRVVIFASWRKNLLVQNLMLRANTLALVFIWIMAPISAILQGLDV